MLGFADRLVDEMSSLHPDVDLICPVPFKVGETHSSAQVRKYFNYLQTYLIFPRRLKRVARRYDVVHISDQGSAHLLKSVKGRKSVITVHDMLAVRASLGEIDYWKIGKSGVTQQQIIRQSLGLATRAACVSDKTRLDFERLVPGVPACVVANAAFNAVPDLKLSREKIFHCIGGNQPYKNRAGNVRAASELLARSGFEDWRFLILGRPPDASVMEAISTSPVKDRIEIVADPNDAKVSEVYRQSQGLLFFSHDEGFGLPILEAQSAECLVCTRDAEPMASVAGKGAVLATGTTPEELANAVVNSWESRHQIIRQGCANVASYTMARMAQEYLAIYKELA